MALGFAGVLIVIGNGSESVIGLGAIAFAILAAAAVASFWPRQRVRGDKEFTSRARELLERDKALLDRFAN